MGPMQLLMNCEADFVMWVPSDVHAEDGSSLEKHATMAPVLDRAASSARPHGNQNPDARVASPPESGSLVPTPREYGPRDPEFSGVIDLFIRHHADLQKIVT